MHIIFFDFEHSENDIWVSINARKITTTASISSNNN